ncbi:hypothetical protein TIFTF001_047090 [Ficus carica]|uniref:Uncharacterized protein n=1 Tax=Ficus carica TaxID=3494 RepID=A0AA88CL21_FICCA|nr:hypothetical protein TIFTF001_047090 [Ficus carica]
MNLWCNECQRSRSGAQRSKLVEVEVSRWRIATSLQQESRLYDTENRDRVSTAISRSDKWLRIALAAKKRDLISATIVRSEKGYAIASVALVESSSCCRWRRPNVGKTPTMKKN